MVSSQSSFNQLSPPSVEREFSTTGATLWNWRKAAREDAIAAAISLTEVDWLLRELTDLDSLALRLESFQTRPAIRLKLPFEELQQLWRQRVEARVPVQYLIGAAPWRQFLLQVSPAVLIPRPETECLIDLAIWAEEQKIKGAGTPESQSRTETSTQSPDNQPLTTVHPPISPLTPLPSPLTPHSSLLSPHSSPLTPPPSPHWADLGTGSGAIALGLATAFPQATIHAVDCSETALEMAQLNAAAYQLQERIRFYQGSWFEPLAALKGKLSGIVSNPPYIPSAIVPELQPEVARHEPHLALDGGTDGLDFIRHLVRTAPTYLQTDGILLLEMMAGQAAIVTQLLHQQNSYHSIQIHADLAGISRFALAYRI
ncbi:peptide chain release factor N(5)-glutamine methyltransferase [Leptothermofonsia sichuanensis E412]|nr:peptide chain release factor N(5)-glutamine methyltransferase [Leptothermofonsia sichuanensis E412]